MTVQSPFLHRPLRTYEQAVLDRQARAVRYAKARLEGALRQAERRQGEERGKP